MFSSFTDRTPPFSEYFVPLPSLYSQWIWNWEGCQVHPVNWSKGILWVLLIPSVPARQPQPPKWEVGREDTTLLSHNWGSPELRCFLCRYLFPFSPIWGLSLAYHFTAQLQQPLCRHTDKGVQQNWEHVASYYCWGPRPPSVLCPFPAPWPKINSQQPCWEPVISQTGQESNSGVPGPTASDRRATCPA